MSQQDEQIRKQLLDIEQSKLTAQQAWNKMLAEQRSKMGLLPKLTPVQGFGGLRCPYCDATVAPGALHACTRGNAASVVTPSGWTQAQVTEARRHEYEVQQSALAERAAALRRELEERERALAPQFRREPVIGFRAWRVLSHWVFGVGSEDRLTSLAYEWTWTPGTNHCGERPNPDNGCGFYVRRNLDELTKHELGKFLECNAVGAVMGWGRVVQHGPEGWRAEFARIVALVDPKFSGKNSKLGARMAREYGVPFLAREVVERYVTEFGSYVDEGQAQP